MAAAFRQRSPQPIPTLSAAELLAYIAERGDLIGRTSDGRAFVLLDLDGGAFDHLCAYGADATDLEDEPDDDAQDEPSLTELHPMDRPASRRRHKEIQA